MQNYPQTMIRDFEFTLHDLSYDEKRMIKNEDFIFCVCFFTIVFINP